MADRLKDEHEDGASALLEGARAQCSIWADLLNAALSEADWGDVADTILADAVEPDDDDADVYVRRDEEK